MKRAWIIVVVVVVCIAGGAWFALRRRGTGAPLETVRVERGELVEVAAVSGTIEPHAQVDVSSRTAGEVIEVAVEEGDHVEAGQLLFRLDATDAQRNVRSAQIEILRLRASLQQSRAQEHEAALDAEESATQADVARRGAELGVTSSDSARQTTHSSRVADVQRELRRAEVAAASAQLAAAQLALEEAQRNLERTEIRAPFAGTILSVDVERGTIVSSAMGTVNGGTTLATLADLSDLRLIGQLDEAQIGAVQVGQAVTFHVDAYPDRTFAGRVERVSPLGEEDSSVVVFDVEIVVTDSDASLLRSGMSADAEIVTRRSEDVLLVPIASIRTRNGAHEVVLPDRTARTVRTGANDGTRIAVVEGVSEGDAIVADALSVATAAPTQASSGLLPGPPRASGNNQRSGGGGPPPP